jgi:hypothetical protein
MNVRLWILLACFVSGLGCKGSSDSKGGVTGTADGAEKGACFPNGTCNAGLSCLSDLCVATNRMDGGGIRSGGSGGSGGASNSGSGGSGGGTCVDTTVASLGMIADPTCVAECMCSNKATGYCDSMCRGLIECLGQKCPGLDTGMRTQCVVSMCASFLAGAAQAMSLTTACADECANDGGAN